jgi:putative hemolysin
MTNNPDPSLPLGIFLIIIVVLLFINAFFAAAEMSILSFNRNKMKGLAQEGNKRAIALLELMEQPNKVIPTIQTSITLAVLLAGTKSFGGHCHVFSQTNSNGIHGGCSI